MQLVNSTCSQKKRCASFISISDCSVVELGCHGTFFISNSHIVHSILIGSPACLRSQIQVHVCKSQPLVMRRYVLFSVVDATTRYSCEDILRMQQLSCMS